ncbi:MAG TPA: hypothetical protein PKM27_07420, partial [Saprospiraceae bacterium]|nr:hypothetical protein [Saprospiraceae bacterium]
LFKCNILPFQPKASKEEIVNLTAKFASKPKYRNDISLPFSLCASSASSAPSAVYLNEIFFLSNQKHRRKKLFINRQVRRGSAKTFHYPFSFAPHLRPPRPLRFI